MALTLSEKAKAVKPSSTLAITAKAKAMKAEGIDVVGFGAGEPDFNTPENICKAAIDAINNGFTKYTPASGTVELKEAICKKFKEFNNLEYTTEQIVVSNGGKQGLQNVFTAILNPSDEVIVPAPFWLSYPEMIKLADGTPVIIYATKENGYKVTAEQVQAAITDKTKAIVINSPSNPTGNIYTKEELEAIAEVVIKNDIYVVADEMYENLIYGNDKHVSIGSLSDEIYKRTITCSGLSKSYAMTGWRIGYVGASKEIAKLMGAVQSHETSNPNSIAQKAAVEALTGDQSAIDVMKSEFNKRREYMYATISSMPYVSCLEPKGAFYVFVDAEEVCAKSYKGEKINDAATMAKILLEDYSVAIIPCADFGFPKHFRLSYAISIEQIKKGLERIEAFLKELK